MTRLARTLFADRPTPGNGFASQALVLALLLSVAFGSAWIASACTRQTSSPPTPAPIGLDKLAYVQDEDIWVKDLPDGAPRRITDHLDRPNARPKWSPSGQWLTFMKGKQLGVMRADGSAARFYDAGWIVWSPVADRLAYVRDASTGEQVFPGELVVENADGSEQSVVARWHSVAGLDGGLAEPAWSANGTSIAYVEQRSQAGTPGTHVYAGIWRVPADGSSTPAEVYSAGSPPHDGVGVIGWTAEGSILFYRMPGFTADLSDGVTLREVRPESGQVINLAPMDPTMLLQPDLRSFAPAGDLLAITDGSGRETWRNKRIAIASWGAGTVTDVTPEDVATMEPAWSSDGKRIAYVAAPDTGTTVSGGDAAKAAMARRKIWVMDADGSNQHPLTADPAYRDERPQWTADGSQILFVRLDANDKASLWLVSADGGTTERVVDDLSPIGLAGAPTWFGYYGYVGWHDVMDWWRGAPGAEPEAGNTGARR